MNASEPIRKATTMLTRSLRVRFLTPAFLGNAEQNGQWRTPPFKHLLREWWRVAWAEENDPADWQRMRQLEGKLFGHAWLDPRKGEDSVSARRSLVRLRLDSWNSGQLKAMPETRSVGDGRNAIASHLYLGYGPVKSASELKMAHPLSPEMDHVTLHLAWPQDEPGSKHVERALALIHAFGTVGGRSRNGWGSLELHPSPAGRGGGGEGEGLPLRPWQTCLEHAWAHAIGEDENGPLIWRTETRQDWKAVIEELATIRKAVNGLAKRNRQREVVNQPVAGRGRRVPNNLRFKVRKDENNAYHGIVFHMPCLPPAVENAQAAQRTWQQIHEYLDDQDALSRSPS